jgi:glycosyltransferase involved in cell wall biosynthesis
MARNAVTISFRLGGDDGVSVEARKWEAALGELGFSTKRIAGAIEDSQRPDDVVIPGLAINATEPVDVSRLQSAIDQADLVVADNLCSLPLNLAAAEAVAKSVETTNARVLFRHHDLPWQRRRLRHLETDWPPRTEGALHATINLRSRRELEARGYDNATTIHNYFDLDPAPGDRATTRKAFGFNDDEFVVFQPARAIERKNVPGGLRFAQRLQSLMPDIAIHYWLSGPAEDGYEHALERVLERATVPVTLGRAATANNAYAAGDLVVFPSTWEGFGNPVIESIAARRACAAYPYPVLAEITATGVRTFSTERVEAVVKFLAEPLDVRERAYDVNLQRARLSYDVGELPAAIDDAFVQHGWIAW